MRTYPHHRPDLLRAPQQRRLVVVTDGWCPGCNRAAPIRRLREVALRHRGLLVVDDSLAFGLLGRRGPGEPFGDGTGTVRWVGAPHGGIVWVASLAKAHGAPLAVVTADRPQIRALRRDGPNRSHSSPPSAADLGVAQVALADPAAPARRARLLGNVRALRARLHDAGMDVDGPPFPVVGVRTEGAAEAVGWWAELRERGVATVVQRSRCRPLTLLTVLVRADHTAREVDRLGAELARLARRGAA